MCILNLSRIEKYLFKFLSNQYLLSVFGVYEDTTTVDEDKDKFAHYMI